ncbi:hypothetical protein OOT46_08400 [Aquabacterium sp. A7-Y]|uniref:hypothetical protein n=1 Tax=Aquabacterium sp. A7-Y TaxID=1349605 RepID=UPI00223E49A7|nr:hypothetical protein [Aquabacterium sp. A7-Y]MCW7537867.1 hypothetical protein [Aquabacterium sp. A7-Y]
MSHVKAAPLRQVPTLTEVVQPTLAESSGDAAPPGASSAVASPLPGGVAAETPPEPPAFLLAGGEDQITQRVLADLQRQIDVMLEYRLRETLTPALARMADQLIRDTRVELAATLREVIARAVAQELARQRKR